MYVLYKREIRVDRCGEQREREREREREYENLTI
jgi:hypothetical protein